MGNNLKSGKTGEREVVSLVPCPNCGKHLMLLPPSYPLYDIQCEGCSFRAQVKTNNCKPKNVVFGAGWDVMSKVLKSGFMVPSLILNFKWKEGRADKREIWFYPFIPKENLHPYALAKTHATHPGYKMFRYTGLLRVPHFVLYKSQNDMGETENIVREFWRLMVTNDFYAASVLLAEDFVLEWPQSGERIRGPRNFAAVNSEYPAHGPWKFKINSLVAGADGAVTDVDVTDGTVRARAVSFFTVKGGKITRITEFWPDPFPAAENRKHLVERIKQ